MTATLGVEEACDDGNLVAQDACTNACEHARCGDGLLRVDLAEGADGYEGCDDGNAIEDDGCTSDCQIRPLATCGDGIVHEDEACDDGNRSNIDACSNACETARCGDGTTPRPRTRCRGLRSL